MKQYRKKRLWIIPLAAILLLAIAFFAYVENYSHADATAETAMVSDESVQIGKADYGWFFDGVSTENLLIFYPGGKVEATAYAPLCRALAENGFDVCLVEMPFRLAFFGGNKANTVINSTHYSHIYLAGHSLGGVFAANYAANHADQIDGVILLASYTTKDLDPDLKTVLIYGSEDGVLNMEAYQKNRVHLPANALEIVIEGGNHAQFGSYGSQKGDGIAKITPKQQIDATVAALIGGLSESTP